MTLLARMKKPDKNCVVYCDPPYLSMTRNGSKYLHDLSTVEEHEALAYELQRLSGLGHQILLSGYANEHYDDWFKKWGRHVMATTRNSRSGRGSTAQEEVLWVSRRIMRRSGTAPVPD
jgi:site-specific DNA-adenine methylase